MRDMKADNGLRADPERKQVVWLAMGAIVVLALTFASGMSVGRRAAKLEYEEKQAKSISEVQAQDAQHAELTFYDKLAEPEPEPKADEPALALMPSPEKEVDKIADQKAAESSEKEEPEGEPQPAKPKLNESIPGVNDGPARSGDYTIQVSSFQSAEESMAFASTLERKGFRPYVVSAKIPGRGTWYRVRLGRFNSEAGARVAKESLAALDIPGWVLISE